MHKLATTVDGLELVAPIPERDAPFAVEWFSSPSGRETLLLMGNAPEDISPPTLKGETKTIEEFLQLEQEGKQLSWMIRYDDKTLGAAWIELTENHGVQPPSIHIMIGDKSYRGRGIGKATMQALIDYINNETHYGTIYTRHLKNNVVVEAMNRSLGFKNDGRPYIDENGLEWQKIIMHLTR